MEFRVLGHIEVGLDAVGVAIGGPKPRTVLALLILRSGTVVSTDSMISTLYGDEAPSGARRSIQTFVSGLRSELGDRIQSSGPGYVLEVPRDAIDAHRFADMVDQSHGLSDVSAKVELLRSALELWRGYPYDNVDGFGVFTPEVARLTELRLVANEHLMDAELAAGHHREIVGELETLSAANPTRERFCAQHMLALYRSGRQADALRAFARRREDLAESGLEPSPDLRDLEGQILNYDSSLAAAAAAAVPPVDMPRVPGLELRSEVGVGDGYAVWRAYQPAFGREVAVKVINAEVANEPAFIRKFEEEAYAMSKLEHPHIVPVYAFWRDPDGPAYLLMRWLGGGSLGDRIAEGPIAPDDLDGVVRNMASALQHAHRSGIAHQAIRPSDVMFDSDGHAYLADVDISLQAHRSEDGEGRAIRSLASLLRACLHSASPAAERSVLLGAIAGEYGDLAAFTAAWRAAVGVGAGVVLDAALPERNPYKGLAPFSERDSRDFFGREDEIRRLVTAVAASRLVSVVGPSGIGKSSVVRAGVIPALRSGAVVHSRDWLIATMVPGARPFDQLATSLSRLANRPTEDIDEELIRDRLGLIRAVERYLPEGEQLLLVIDQFEELFTLVPDETTRRSFLDVLAAAATDESSNVRIILTLRADFFDRPLRYGGFGECFRSSVIAIAAPGRDALTDIITKPATSLGVTFEPDLVERIITDVVDQPGTMPLLEFFLTELYSSRRGEVLDVKDYEAHGGVIGALGRRADHTYAALGEPGQAVVAQIFLRLVSVSATGRDTRRRVARGELEQLGIAPDLVAGVLDAYHESRLLTFDLDPTTHGPTVELAHEAMIEEWPRLRHWLDDHRSHLLLQRKLADAANDWEENARSSAFLLSTGQLATHEEWVASTGLSLRDTDHRFLDASRSAERARVAAQRRSRLWVMAGLTAVAMLGIALAIVANSSRQSAVAANVQALRSAAFETADTDPALGLALALEAEAHDPDGDGGAAVFAATESFTGRRGLALDVFESGEGRVWSVAFSDDGRRLIAATDTNLGLQDWDTAAGTNDAWDDLHLESLREIAFSPDGSLLVTASLDSTVKVWDAVTGAPVSTLAGHGWQVWKVAFSNDGSMVATGARDGTARIWDPLTGDELLRIDVTPEAATDDPEADRPPPVWAVRWSPDDSTLATAGEDGVVRLWELTARGGSLAAVEVSNILAHSSPAQDIAWSADGATLYTAGDDGDAAIWDVATGERIGNRLSHSDPLRSLSLSPDGNLLVTAGTGGEVHLWNVVSRRREAIMTGHRGVVWDVSFNSDGTAIATAGDDGSIRLWDAMLSPGTLLVSDHIENVFRSDQGVRSIVYSPDGTAFTTALRKLPVTEFSSTGAASSAIPVLAGEDPADVRFIAVHHETAVLAAGTEAGQVDLFTTDGTALRSIAAESPIRGLAFSPDGEQLLVGTKDAGTKLYDVASGALISEFSAGEKGVRNVALTTTGRAIVAEGIGVITVWDVAAGEQLATLRPEDLPEDTEARTVAVQPGERIVAVGYGDGSIALWDIESSSLVASWHGHRSGIRSLAWHPAGEWLASGGDDSAVMLWDGEPDIPGEDRLVAAYRRQTRAVWSLAWHPDGTTLASGSDDGLVVLRTFDADVATACGWLTPYLSIDEVRTTLDGDPIACGSSP